MFEDIVAEGLVADLATDQNGSRFIQTKLEEASDADKQAVFEQILPETLRLCTDVFGNYCIRKILKYNFTHNLVERNSLNMEPQSRSTNYLKRLSIEFSHFHCKCMVVKLYKKYLSQTQNMIFC